MGISKGAIQRQMRRIDPVALADRLVDRERAKAETSASEAAGHVVDIVFVERGGSASARKALVKITHKLEGARHLHMQIILLTGADTQGDGTKATASLHAEIKQCAEAEEKRAAKRRREDEETALVVADLQARLEASEERADNVRPRPTPLKTEARKKSDALQHSLARAEERFRDIQAAKETVIGPSSGAITYTEDEVEEMEVVIGDLTRQLYEMRKVRKHDEIEYARNRSAVSQCR